MKKPVAVGDRVAFRVRKQTIEGVLAQKRVRKANKATVMLCRMNGVPVPKSVVCDVVLDATWGDKHGPVFRVLPVEDLMYGGIGSVTAARESYKEARVALKKRNAAETRTNADFCEKRGLFQLRHGDVVSVVMSKGKPEDCRFLSLTPKRMVRVEALSGTKLVSPERVLVVG